MPRKQHLYAYWDTWSPDSNNKEAEMLYDWRYVTRFVSAHEKKGDMAVTVSPSHGLLHVTYKSSGRLEESRILAFRLGAMGTFEPSNYGCAGSALYNT